MEDSLTMRPFTGVWEVLREPKRIAKNPEPNISETSLSSLCLEGHGEGRVFLKLNQIYNLGHRVVFRHEMDSHVELKTKARMGAARE